MVGVNQMVFKVPSSLNYSGILWSSPALLVQAQFQLFWESSLWEHLLKDVLGFLLPEVPSGEHPRSFWCWWQSSGHAILLQPRATSLIHSDTTTGTLARTI